MSTDKNHETRPAEKVGRALGGRFSTAVVLFHSAVADKLGVNVTDWKCAEILFRTGPTNPGKLSEITGMTTAATAQVVRRLEKAGMVKREQDPDDGRKVILTPSFSPEMAKTAGTIFAQLGQAMATKLVGYTESELDVISRFVETTTEILEAQAAALRKRMD